MAQERPPKRRRLSPVDSNGAIPGFARWNIEQDYERRPRKDKTKTVSNRLPIKRDGRVEQASTENSDTDEEQDEQEDAEIEVVDSSVTKDGPQLSQPALPRKEQVRQAKEELARMAGAISETPDERIGMLKSLAAFAASENETIQRLALGTQLAVFKDIIPGYRIRALSSERMQVKVSKDVRKLRDFEQSLLSGYRHYVEHLTKLAKDRQHPMSGVAIACACVLLENVSHFNFRNNLIAILIHRLSSRSINADFVKAREAMERLFREDEEGHASLEAVNGLTKMMKARDYAVHQSVLNTFLHLRLLSEFSHKASTNSVDKDEVQTVKPKDKSKQKKQFRTKRERKLLKERKEVEKEMKEADAAVSYEDRDKNQAEMLKLVFVAYFRILKDRVQHLMGAVLEGLAKYAHLINQDFFGDILEALKDLMNDAEALLEHDEEEGQDEEEQDPSSDQAATRDAARESLLCVITAFALLQGQNEVAKSAKALHLDLNFFITRLYRAIMPLSQEADIELSAKTARLADPDTQEVQTAADAKINVATTTVLLLRSLEAVLLPKTATKMVPPVRIAAFTKQMLSAALHLPPKSTEAVVALLQQVSKTHGPRIAALWNTEERKGDGVFSALSAEVESSNPFASTVWEGELLRLHFDPKVRDSMKALEKNIAEV